VNRHGQPRLQAPVNDHYGRDPVQRPREVHQAGEQPEKEGAADRAGAEERNERREGDPRRAGWPNFGKLNASSRPDRAASR
jgi:hypothetical protein